MQQMLGQLSGQPTAVQSQSNTQENEHGGQSQVSKPEYNIVTLLPLDGIPSIDNPTFVTGVEADKQYHPDELVLGVEINGDAWAYSTPFLSGHEIVNDTVGGVATCRHLVTTLLHGHRVCPHNRI